MIQSRKQSEFRNYAGASFIHPFTHSLVQKFKKGYYAVANQGRKIIRTRSNDDGGGGGSWFKIKKFLAGFDYDERMCNFGSCGEVNCPTIHINGMTCDSEGYSTLL